MEDMVSAIWAGRRVLVTGHTGFKGSWLALWLWVMKAQVRGYALAPSTDPNLFDMLQLGTLIDDVRGDVADAKALSRCLEEFQPEVVFHLAAQPLVRQSYVDPVGTYATNVMGTANLLEAIRHTSSVRAVVVITTDKCYRNHEEIRSYTESDPLGGHDPYSSSKACVEILTASYRDSFFPVARLQEHGVAIATARAGNVVGGGDWSQDRLIPDLIRGILRDTPVHIRYPDAVRPWQHVLEPLASYLMLAERLMAREPLFADAWNFGPSDESVWTVGQVATAVQQRWGAGAAWIRDAAPAWHEAASLCLDSSKARRQLRWSPQLTMEQTLDWVVTWFRAWHDREDMRAVTLNQIRAYESLLSKGATLIAAPQPAL
jgi:CDP-glucose 4,6-dehydratase